MGLIVVSNRLPVVLRQRSDGGVEVQPGSGGLVTALRPVLRDRGGVWIGAPGSGGLDGEATRRLFAATERESGYELIPVELTRGEQRGFYQGFSNEAIWPLFHDLVPLTRFHSGAWSAALRVSARFAASITNRARPGDFVWVHDYHLVGVGRALRASGFSGRVAFFLHIPFPALDMFLKLPWRAEVLASLLTYDLVGVQTMRDRRNLLQCVRALVPGVEIEGSGGAVSVRFAGREVRIGAFPIGIDFDEFASEAGTEPVAAKAASLRADESNRKIVLGVDRLDYTKGLPERLEAFALLLERTPALRGKVTLVEFVVPSRETLSSYAALKRELERAVGEINGRFTRSGWVPVRYNFRAIPRSKLLAYYRAADVALVTPLKDGMNLVAKEFCAARVDGDGVLVLSEFAGAAAQLQHGAILVNPWDTAGTAGALARALDMPRGERRARMRKLRRAVRKHDIHRWVDSFLDAAISRSLEGFPRVEEFVPVMEHAGAVPAH